MKTKKLRLTLLPFDTSLRTNKRTHTLTESDKRDMLSLILKRIAVLLDSNKPNEYKAIQLANLFLDIYNNYQPSNRLFSHICSRYNCNKKMNIYPIPIERVIKLINNIYISISEPIGISNTLSNILSYIRWTGTDPIEALEMAINQRKDRIWESSNLK